MTLATSNMEVVGTWDTNATWYDIMVPRDADAHYTEMEEADWDEFKNELYVTTKGSLLGVIGWVEHISKMRALKSAPKREMEDKPAYWSEFRMWLDMVNEPEKYGDDIIEFTELDTKLAASQGRWRLHAEWLKKDAELKASEVLEKEKDAAVMMQALFRGHQARIHMGERLNCGMCLKHQPCFNMNNGTWMCDACFEWQPCGYCGCDVHADNRDEYRPGFWCSQDCANELI